MKRRGALALASALALSLGLAGCSNGAGDSSAAKADDKGIITVNTVEPQNPLIPTSTNETGGGRVIDALFSGLVYYEPKTGEAKNELAESIESKDQVVWTIKLKKDAKFSDGSPIKADNYIKAWNYGANPKNAQMSSSFFEVIKGFTPGPEEEGAQAPDVPELAGLKKIDDYTFEVTLNQPTSDFALRLGYSAYVPLPDVAFKDMKAYGQNPTVTSGPYMLKDKGWHHNESIELVKNDKYAGPREAKNGGVTFKIYTKSDAAYADVQSGQLDVLDDVPAAAMNTFQSDFPDSNANIPVAVFQSFTIPDRLKHFGMDEEGRLRRQAISYALDRASICEKIFQKTRVPAKDFTSPAMPNYDKVMKQVKGAEVLKFDKAKAKELWAKADAISKFEGKFTIGYNSDSSHKDWVDAVANQLKTNLGIEAVGDPYPDFKGLRDAITQETIKGAFRSGWQADYPGMSNFLEPLYSKNGNSNDGKYNNEEFNKLMVEISKLPVGDEQDAKFAEAQRFCSPIYPPSRCGTKMFWCLE
ncbi:MAG: ABC transporter substrate-binding protein [Varibaculum cambriense]